jgi:hypothetical protein
MQSKSLFVLVAIFAKDENATTGRFAHDIQTFSIEATIV